MNDSRYLDHKASEICWRIGAVFAGIVALACWLSLFYPKVNQLSAVCMAATACCAATGMMLESSYHAGWCRKWEEFAGPESQSDDS